MDYSKELNQKEYNAIRTDFEKRYGYEHRSDAEKEAFDKKFDEYYKPKNKNENMDYPKELNQKEYNAIRTDFEKRYGYEHRSDAEKEAFDKKFGEYYKLKNKNESNKIDNMEDDTEDVDPADEMNLGKSQGQDEISKDSSKLVDDESKKKRIDTDGNLKLDSQDTIDENRKYDVLRKKFEKEYGYEFLSDKEKEKFDEIFDKYVQENQKGFDGEEIKIRIDKIDTGRDLECGEEKSKESDDEEMVR